MNLTLANTPARTGRGGGFALTYGMNRAARITTIIMLVLVTLLAINALAVAFTPAHALKLTEMCDQQFSYNAPVESKGSLGASNPQVNGLNVTPSGGSYSGIGSISQAYGLSGISWQVSGNTFCNSTVMNPVTTGMANFLLSGIVAMGSLFITIVQVALSSALVQAILERTNLLSTVTGAVQGTFWAEWGPFITVLSLLLILWFMFRKGVKDAGGRLLWVAAAAALLASSVTTPLLADSAARVQDIRAGMGASLSTTFMGKDCPAEMEPAECITSAVSSGVIDPVFNYGAAGDMADLQPRWVVDTGGDKYTTGTRDPGSVVIYKEDANMDWDGKKSKSVTLPAAGAVPTTNEDGRPTVAEYMRWTQTYTAAETAAIKGEKLKGCSTLNAPSQDKLDDKSGEELCYYKWQVRSALLYSMAGDTSVASYNAASGNQDFNYRIQPAILAFPTSGLALIAGGFIGTHMSFLQLEYIVKIIMVLFVFVLVILKASPRPFFDWGGGVLLNIIKSALLSMMFGGLIVLWELVNKGVRAAFSDPSSPLFVATVASPLMPIIMTAFLFGVGVIVLYVLYFKALKKLTEGNPTLAAHNRNSMGAKLKGGTNKTLAAGTAGVTTAVSGGTLGAATFAAFRTGSRVSSDPDASLMRGITSGITQGHRSGGKSAAKQAAKNSAAERIGQSRVAEGKMNDSFNAAELEMRSAQNYQADAQQYQHKAEEAERDAAAATFAAEQLEHQSDNAFDAFAKSTPEGQALQQDVVTAGNELDRAGAQSQQKQDDLDAYLLAKGVSESHARVTDPTTGRELTEVTNLSTGAKTLQPAKNYNPALEQSKLFKPAELDHYNQLATKRDQARTYSSEAANAYNTAQRSYADHVQDTRAKVLTMTNTEIDKTYGTGIGNPQQGKMLRDWKAEQQQAQNLHAQASGYMSEAQKHRAQQNISERAAAGHANAAQKHVYDANSYMRRADTLATPTTTEHKKMADGYKQGDHIRQHAPRLEAIQAQAQSYGATRKPVKVEYPDVTPTATQPYGQAPKVKQYAP